MFWLVSLGGGVKMFLHEIKGVLKTYMTWDRIATASIAFLMGVSVGAILHHLYLTHGLGWNLEAIGTTANIFGIIANIILVGALVVINKKYLSIVNADFLREQEKYKEERKKDMEDTEKKLRNMELRLVGIPQPFLEDDH